MVTAAVPPRLANLPPNVLRLIASRLPAPNQVRLAMAGKNLHAPQKNTLLQQKHAKADEDRLVAKMKEAARVLQALKKLSTRRAAGAAAAGAAAQGRQGVQLPSGFRVTHWAERGGKYFAAESGDVFAFRGHPVFLRIYTYMHSGSRQNFGISIEEANGQAGSSRIAILDTEKSAGGSTFTDTKIFSAPAKVREALPRVLRRVTTLA